MLDFFFALHATEAGGAPAVLVQRSPVGVVPAAPPAPNHGLHFLSTTVRRQLGCPGCRRARGRGTSESTRIWRGWWWRRPCLTARAKVSSSLRTDGEMHREKGLYLLTIRLYEQREVLPFMAAFDVSPPVELREAGDPIEKLKL